MIEIPPEELPDNAGEVPAENLFAYLFLNREVWRRFDVEDDQVIYHEPVTLQDVTYGRLRDDSLRLAQSLSKLVAGVSAKDDFGVPGSISGPVVMIHLLNVCAFPVIFLGGLAANCTMNLASPSHTPQELAYVMELVHPDVIFTQPGKLGADNIKKALQLLPKSSSKPKLFTVDALEYPPSSSQSHVAPDNWLSLLNVDASFRPAPMTADEQAHRVACIMWSSGTTGKSKGVMHSHRSLIASNVLQQKYSRFQTDDAVWLGLPPFYHIMGLQTIMLVAPLYGTKVVLMRDFELERYLRLVTKYKVSYLNLAPPLALALTKTPLLDEPWCDISSVRAAGCGAAPLGPDIIREFYKRTGKPILMGYGLSETGCFTYRPNPQWEQEEKHLGFSGVIMPDVEIEIRDEAGKPVSNGQPGEIMMRSNLQMMGYVRNPEANAATFAKDGFVHTGDIGIFNDDRFIKIVDRMKDVIKYHGYQVSPVELDAVIGALPSVLDVGTTSVYSDEQASELPKAYVVPRSSELLAAIKSGEEHHSGLKAFATEVYKAVEEQCAHYKQLRGGIVLCAEVTKSPTGKIVRRSLKDIKGIYVPYKSSRGVKAKL